MAGDQHVRVIIVGAGLSGLLCALECQRHGLKPLLLESRDTQAGGDFIMIGPSAIRSFEKWPKLHEAFQKTAYSQDLGLYYTRQNGGFWLGPHRVGKTFGQAILRPELHRLLQEAVLAAGITIRKPCHVVEYFESADQAGVRLDSGETILSDIVVAADGIKSRSRILIDTEEPAAYDSGTGLYRAAMPKDVAMQIPGFREAWDPELHGESMLFYLSSDRHGIILIGKDKVCWGLNHPDKGATAQESWTASASSTVEEALETLDEDDASWDPLFRAVVAATPPGKMIHWQLKWREIPGVWTSPLGRVVQIGDAAHAYLPTSANGGTQALEDSVSIAACLRLAVEKLGKAGIPKGTKVHNTLRLDRVGCVHEIGFTRRRAYYGVDWEAAKRDIRVVAAEPPPWVYAHDPESYAFQNFDACLAAVQAGQAFKNTNVPDGYVFKKGVIAELGH